MGTNVPDLTGNDDAGSIGGIPSGPAVATNPPSLSEAKSTSPVKTLQTRWRPPTFLDLHSRLAGSRPQDVSFDVDRAFNVAYQNMSQLENMIACRQSGEVVVTGSAKGVKTGLSTVSQVTVSIDHGATAHNFTVSGVISQFPGAIDIYCWQPTGVNNTTPIACTTAVTVRWIATGSIAG